MLIITSLAVRMPIQRHMHISDPLHEEAIIHFLVLLGEVYNSASYMGGTIFLKYLFDIFIKLTNVTSY